MNPQEKLQAMARAAGLAGQEWMRWTGSDEVQAIVDACEKHFETDTLEAAYCDGRRERRITVDGWRVLWTTAPADYDGFGTETIAIDGEWYGKPLRRIVVDPDYVNYQTARNDSGLHPTWEEDPRIAEAKAKERLEKDRAERAAYDAKRAEGLQWVRTATEDELEDLDTFEARGLKYADVRAEKVRRTEEAETFKRDTEWSRCLALIPDGATLIDDGQPSERGQFGVIRGRDPHVYHAVKIVRGWPDDADHANVMGEGHENAGSPAYVADWIASGRLRVATAADNVPPYAVLKRIGHARLAEIRCHRVEGRTVWIGRATFGETMHLDDKGHLIRSKKILQQLGAV
jgi:hypothetical protein